LTRRESAIVWIAATLVALTRFLAVARTLWDWDEALFALALRDFDVVAHHPHPPGFPLFIGAAKLVTLFGAGEFRALQIVTVAASLLVFPAMVLLARELRATFFVTIASGLLLAFSPNVWFFGGTALSDVPAMVLAVVASALLLRGVRDGRWLVTGAVVLALAAGFRPQCLLIGCVPALIACRRWKPALIGALIALAILITTYATAAQLSGGWSAYRDALATHEHYIRVTDSFLSPIRPPLWKVADDFFFWPYRVPPVNIAIALLMAIALMRLRVQTILALAIFGPFLLFAWLYLDFHSTSRFSVAYMPLFALLAADGLEVFGRIRAIILAALLALTIGWMLEPLRVVRETIAPPVAAADWIRTHHHGPVTVDPRVEPFAALLLDGYELRPMSNPAGVILREGTGTRTFARERERLSRALTRPRYFEIAVDDVR
jgi:hypothetical protein